ncbi:MAG: GNAT family N-acetyltransferase [Paludibacteraceae bacterium]|nr:GNAT family N-acetyltransferase [Paludibacteraceae bacterium]
MPPCIERNHILLRPWRDEDAPLLYRYASDPDVGPRAGWAPHQSVEESLHIIQTVFRNPTTWAIVRKEDDLLVGAIGYGPSCECNLPAREGEPTVGYWIAKPFWNQGLCTEALQLLIAHLRQQNESNENTGEVPTASRTVICEKNENNRGRDAHVPSTIEAFSSLISGHFTDNPASGRVMEKCGFVPTGDICYDPTLYNGAARPNLSRLVGIRVLRLTL